MSNWKQIMFIFNDSRLSKFFSSVELFFVSYMFFSFFTYINPYSIFVFLVFYIVYAALFSNKFNYSTYVLTAVILNALYSLSLLLFILNTSDDIGFFCNKFYFDGFLIGNQPFYFTIYIDFLSANVSLLTSGLSSLLTLYSFFYMKNDVFSHKFIQLIQSFSISMLFFLMAGDAYSMLLGWELIGLFSFFLISFWTYKVSSLKAALKAFFFNKFSDFFFLLFLALFVLDGGPDLVSFFRGSSGLSFGVIYHDYFLFVLLCGFFKSVQFGFHLWLPDSMEAPIPASSLIHSATLVSAGLYLSMRFICYINPQYNFFYFLSIFTAFYGSCVAFFQTDLKKILAYSTISHCGYMFLPVFFNQQDVFILYFYVHGFTKALSFSLIGLVIQDVSTYQDSRKITLIWGNNTPSFFLLPFIVFSLGGLPFFFGFFSKMMLVYSLNSGAVMQASYFLISLSSAFAVMYSMNITNILFFNKKGQHICIPNNGYSYQPSNTMALYFCLMVIFFTLFLYASVDVFLINKIIYTPLNSSWAFYFYKVVPVFFFLRFSDDYYRDSSVFLYLPFVFI